MKLNWEGRKYGLRHVGYRQSHIWVNTSLKKFFDFIQNFFSKKLDSAGHFRYNYIKGKSFSLTFNHHGWFDGLKSCASHREGPFLANLQEFIDENGNFDKKGFRKRLRELGQRRKKKEERLSRRNAFDELDLTPYNATNLIIDGKKANIVYK